jgi:hypothetical protein
MSLASLANGDRQRSLRFTVWDWNASGKPDLIGAFETSVERLEAGQLTHQVSCFFIREWALFMSSQFLSFLAPGFCSLQLHQLKHPLIVIVSLIALVSNVIFVIPS